MRDAASFPPLHTRFDHMQTMLVAPAVAPYFLCSILPLPPVPFSFRDSPRSMCLFLKASRRKELPVGWLLPFSHNPVGTIGPFPLPSGFEQGQPGNECQPINRWPGYIGGYIIKTWYS